MAALQGGMNGAVRQGTDIFSNMMKDGIQDFGGLTQIRRQFIHDYILLLWNILDRWLT